MMMNQYNEKCRPNRGANFYIHGVVSSVLW